MQLRLSRRKARRPAYHLLNDPVALLIGPAIGILIHMVRKFADPRHHLFSVSINAVVVIRRIAIYLEQLRAVPINQRHQRHQQRRPHGIRVLIVNPRAQVPAHKSGHQRRAQGPDIKLQISLLLMSEYHAQRSKHRSQQRHHIAEPVNRAVLLRVDLHCVCRPVSHG